MLKDKRILIGVCGGIAAYKVTFLVRLLVKAGAEVKVVMTPSAKDFVTPLSLATLSKNPVVSDFTTPDDSDWNNHVKLAIKADLMLIAPATANTIGKMVNGICDNLLMAVYMSAKCPVMVAPAMDLDMYRHPSTKNNLDKLNEFGHKIIPAEKGELASGLEGEGRMAEPDTIFDAVQEMLGKAELKGKKVLVSAGPTYESIDPVRFVGNHSSGKMGVAIAEAAAKQGARVKLVIGPSQVKTSHPNIERINVMSAQEMYDACVKAYDGMDIAIMSAAVSDYTPKEKAEHKIKKSKDVMKLELVKTKDILGELGRRKKKGQFLVGFALETRNEVEYAREKIESKKLDLIVMNTLQDEGAGFGHDTNKITIIDSNNNLNNFELKTKQEAAEDIIQAVISGLKNA